MYFPYFPLVLGLLILLRRGYPWAAAALVAIAIAWLSVMPPLGLLGHEVLTYEKLAAPSTWDYLKLVHPLRHGQAMLLALLWIPATLAAPRAYGAWWPIQGLHARDDA
jgi:hypothetical protein